MKTSIEHLTDKARERLSELVGYILDYVPETQYIILYGSYAGNNYVEYDQRIEFGLRTCFQSDFDIVVLTPKKRASSTSVERRLQNAARKFYGGRHFTQRPTVQFLAENVEEFNQAIIEGRYFYTDIIKTGIILYNSGKYEIEPIRELNYGQIHRLSLIYFDDKYSRAESFFKVAQFCIGNNDYRMASFLFHLAAENYCLSLILSASLYASKEHDIVKLIENTTRFTPVVAEILNDNTPEEKRLLELLQKAYVQARYNKDFVVTKDDADALFTRIEKLRVKAELTCANFIEEHKQRIVSTE